MNPLTRKEAELVLYEALDGTGCLEVKHNAPSIHIDKNKAQELEEAVKAAQALPIKEETENNE